MASLNFKFVANAAGLTKGINDAKGNLTGFESATKTVSANIGKALGAISFVAVVKGLTDAAKAAQEDQIAQEKLALQLRTSTGANDAQIASVEKNITAMSKQTGIADDVLRPALANAARATGDMNRAQELLTIGLDFAAASGKPLETVMSALQKAENGNTTALYKLAPELKNTKGGIDDLAKSVEGAAEASANPFAKFQVSLDEAKETIGAAFLPVLQKLIDVLGPLVEKLAPILAKLIADLTPVFLTLVDALLPLVEELLPPLVELIQALVPVLLPLIQILTDILVPVVHLLADAFKGVLGFIKPLIEGVGKFVDAFKKSFPAIVQAVRGPINLILTAIEGYFNFVIKGVNTLIDGINVLLSGINAVTGSKLKVGKIPAVKIPRLAEGGVVMPRPGGVLANIAEAGQPEAVIPLDRLGNMGGNNTYNININRAALSGIDVITAIRRYETASGRKYLLGNG